MSNLDEINIERERLRIQLETNELVEIVDALNPPVNFLVFGAGNDSIFWQQKNKNGRTVFIEDKKIWFDELKIKFPSIEAYLVNYDTKREDWKQFIDNPQKLNLPLPKNITDLKWDVILVDGPAGYKDGKPGRMKSIFMASKLIKKGGDLFVHDVEREIERAFCEKYLSTMTIVNKVKGRALLAHYKA